MQTTRVLCENCQKKAPYHEKKENECLFCGKQIKIDEELEKLVVVLNNIGITTIASCKGEEGGFDKGLRSYPWVAISKESVMKAEEIIKSYNKEEGEENERKWLVEVQETVFSLEWFIVPARKERRIEKLLGEVFFLANYIGRCF